RNAHVPELKFEPHIRVDARSHPPQVHITNQMPESPDVTVNAPITLPAIHVGEKHDHHIEVPVPVVNAPVTVQIPENKKSVRTVKRDKDGNIAQIIEETK